MLMTRENLAQSTLPILDYGDHPEASNLVLPRSATFASAQDDQWHFEMQAKQLLKQGKLSLVDISLECGFANQGHLNRHFKRLTGTTPKEVARMYKTSKIV
jgi:Helix-turn-helix domain